MACTMASASFSSARPFSRYSGRSFTHDNDGKRLLMTTKQAIDDKRGLTRTVNNGKQSTIYELGLLLEIISNKTM